MKGEAFLSLLFAYLDYRFPTSMSLTELPKQNTATTRKNYPAEAQLHSLFEQAPSAIVIFKGPDAVFELANKRALEIIGKPKEAIVGQKLAVALPELKDQGYIELINKVYNSGEMFIADEAPVTFFSNGKRIDRFVKYIFQPLKDEHGNITGVMVVGDDVSQQVLTRKKIEESEALLRKTKEQLELSIEAGKIGVWHWDVKKEQMTWSREQFEIFGVDKTDFRGDADDFFKHVIEEDLEKVRKASGLEYQRSYNQYEFRIRRKDGEIRWIQSRSKTYMDENGDPQYITGINVDITEQVLARKKIEESEKKYRSIFETAEVSLWEEDFTEVKAAIDALKQRGIKDFRKYFKEHPEVVEDVMKLIKVTDVNQTTIEMFEAKGKTELLGSLPRIFTPESVHVFADELVALAEEKTFFEAEAMLSTVKGNPVWILFTMKLPPSSEKFDRVLFSCLDISKSKRAEEALKQNEEKNRLFIEYAPAAMAMFDKEMRYVSVSKQWMKEYDLSGNIIGQKHYELFPNILQRWKDVHSRCMLGAVEKSDEDFYIKDDGTPVWLKWDVHPWYNANGEIGGIVIFTENITESKKAEQAIKENEERLRMAFESGHIGAWEYNPFTQKLICSPESRKICGIPVDLDPDFNLMMKYIYHADQEYFIECIRKSLSHTGDGIFEMMIRFIRYDDQQLRWVRVNGTVFFNEDHLAQKLIGTMMDVTEEKNQQLALKQSEERFRAMANEAPLFVWETDEKLQTTYLNKAGLDYFKLEEPIRMSDLSWKKYIHPDDLEKVLSTMKEAANSFESYTLEMRLRNGLTGEYHWFLDKGAPRYQNDQFVGFIGTSLDINERKEIEKALEEKVKARTRELAGQNILLQKQNDLVKKIFDSSVDSIGVYDTELKIITLNQSSLKLIGRKEEDLIGKKLLDVLPQMEGTKGHTDLVSAINGKTIHNKVYYSEVTNRYYENFLMPLKDENDKVYAVLVMAHDNTELITSAEKLKEAQQIAQIGHWDWDVLTGHLSWSDNMYNIYGVDPKEGIDYERFISLVHPDDRPHMQTSIEHAMQTEAFNDFFHRIITPAGIEKIMHARGEVIVDKNGKAKRMVGTGQDVTKQKLLEKQLIETGRKFEERNRFVEKLISSSLDLIMVVDRDLRFITLNKKAESVLSKIFKGPIVGEKITDINPSLIGTQPYLDLLEAFKGNIIIRDKVKSTVDSDQYFEHNYIPLFDEDGEVYAVMIISHDITESIRQMEELRKLYESDEQKNNFIAMASHELKTPITSIKGYVQLLLNALEKEKDSQKALPPLLVRSSLISVDKQIKRLTRLISELLDISKIETGTLELKKEKFSINELAIETIEDILYTNTKHRINLYHDFQSHVYGDKDRIGQVMINFLTNAIKYSPDSDKIDVSIRKESNEEVSFSVRDYGIGIEKAEQEKIFERFYRAKGKAEQTYPGFGIGLFIAYEFIQKHGGQVWVKSEKGKGSTFTFTLPIYKEQ